MAIPATAPLLFCANILFNASLESQPSAVALPEGRARRAKNQAVTSSEKATNGGDNRQWR